MPTRIELDATNAALLTQQNSGDKITGTEIRAARVNDMDYVDQQDAALTAALALKASIAYVDAQIAGVSGGGATGPYTEINGTIVNVQKGYKTLTGATIMTVDAAIIDAVVGFFNDSGTATLTLEGEALTLDSAAGSLTVVSIQYINGAYHFYPQTGIISVSGAGPVQLATPTLTMTVDSDTAITCNYTNVPNESSYQVQIATNAGFTTGLQTATPAANDTSHQFTGLTASTQYFGRVKAVGDGVSFSDSAYGSDDATTSAPGAVTLNAPTSFAAGTPTPDGAPFTWVDANTSPNESSYLIQITTAADTTYSSVVATRTPAADATSAAAGTGLSGSTNYRARIKSVGNGTSTLDSAYSTEVTFTTDVAGVDSDAQAFLTAHALLGPALSAPEQDLVNDLVVAYKANGTWVKKDIILPHVGTTAAQHGLNLKDPTTFPVTWSASAPGFSATGVDYAGGSGIGYGDTGYNCLTHFTATDAHMAFYSRTSGASTSQVFDMGASTDAPPGHSVDPVWLICRHAGDICGSNFGSASATTSASANGQGFFVAERDGGNNIIYKNGALVASVAGTASYPSENLFIGAANGGGTAGNKTNKECALVEIGAVAHTAAEIGNDYTAVQAFQTGFSRQV